jgi:hypothetical protein
VVVRRMLTGERSVGAEKLHSILKIKKIRL